MLDSQRGVAFAERGVAGVDKKLLPGLRVFHRDQPQIRHDLLGRVGHVHCHHVMPLREVRQRCLPAGLTDEVRDDEHGAASL